MEAEINKVNDAENGDVIFRLLQKCDHNVGATGLHSSFVAEIKDGTVFVNCRKDGVYVEAIITDVHDNNVTSQWVGTLIAAANRLDMLGMDPLTVQM